MKLRNSHRLYYKSTFKLKIIAHEIGHNLGMYHDFGSGGTWDTKYSASGELCTGVGGYMDYQSNPNRWSQCSVEDFTTYVNSVNPWCLDECKFYHLYSSIYDRLYLYELNMSQK